MTDRGDSFVNVEHQAFSALYSTLRTGVRSDLSHVVSEAFSRDLIPQRVKAIAGNASSLQTEDDRACALLDAINERIQNRPQSYQEFADILESIPAFRYLADSMKKKKNDLVEKGNTQNNNQQASKDVKSKQRLSSTLGKPKSQPDLPLLALADIDNQDSNMLSPNSLPTPLLSPIGDDGACEIDETQEPEIEVVTSEGDLIPPDPNSNEGETVPSLAVVNNEEHQHSKSDFLWGFCCSGITFILLAPLSILGIVEIGCGIYLFLQLERCLISGLENRIFGSCDVLLGVTLIIAVVTVSLHFFPIITQRYGYCTARKWRILKCFSVFCAVFLLFLIPGLLVFSMILAITIYPLISSFPHNGTSTIICSRASFYLTVTSLVITNALLGMLVTVVVIVVVCLFCVAVIKSTMCPERLQSRSRLRV